MATVTPSRIKDLLRADRERPVPAYLNLWAVCDGVLVGVDLQLSAVFECTGVDTLLMSPEQAALFHEQLRAALQGVPVNATVQLLVQVRRSDRYRPDAEVIRRYRRCVGAADPLSRYIVDRKVEHFLEQQPYRRRTFLTVTAHPPTADLLKMDVPLFAVMEPDYRARAAALNAALRERLEETVRGAVEGLRAAGVQCRRLGEGEIVALLYEHLNPGRAETLPCGAVSPERTLRTQIVCNAVRNEFSECFIDGYYHRAVTLHRRPREVSAGDTVAFGHQLTGEYDWCVSVHVPDQEAALKQLGFEATLASVIGGINPFRKNYDAAIKAHDCRALAAYVKNNHQRLYQVSLHVVLRDRSLEALTARCSRTLAAFRTLGDAEGIVDDMNHWFLHLASLPNHAHYNRTRHLLSADAVTQLLPVHAGWRGTREARMVFLTRDHELLPFDLFDEELPAKHAVVLGTTGSGKSFTTNYLLTNFFVESPRNHIIVVDIGGSYRKLCRLFGGDYLEVKLSDEYSFNPFPPRDVAMTEDPQGATVDYDVVAYLKGVLQKMLNRPTLSGRESHVLDTAIVQTYLAGGYRSAPTVGHLFEQLCAFRPLSHGRVAPGAEPVGAGEARRIAAQFAADLEEWLNPQGKGRLLNRETSVDPSGRMVVFDLQGLQEHRDLQAIVLFLIQNVIWRKLYDKTLRKMIVFDECWALFNDPVSAQLVENLYRTARKFNAMVLSVSQSPDDFLASRSAAAVLANSYTKYILRLQKGHEVLQQFGFTAPEIALARTLQSVRRRYSEVLLKFMDRVQVLRIDVPRSDYFICTTDADDEQRERAFRRAHPGATELDVLRHFSGEGGDA